MCCFFYRLLLLPTLTPFFGVHLTIFIDIYRELCLCASFLLRIAGGGAAPSPLHPPTRFYILLLFLRAPLATYSHSFFFVSSYNILIDIYRELCLCPSFLLRIAKGGAAPSPLHPPTSFACRFYFLIGSPCYLLSVFIGIY